jgi:hypothetical protein
MGNRYQIPIQLAAEAPVQKIPLMQLMSFGAAGAGSGAGSGRTVSIILSDYTCPEDPVTRDLIPEMPMLRIAFGGILQVVSVRARVGGSAEERVLIQTSRGFDGMSNPYLELLLDATTLSSRPCKVGILTDPDLDWSTTVGFGLLSNVGDMFWLYSESADDYLWVVQGSWLDTLLGRITGDPNATGYTSPSLRFTFQPPPLLQLPPGTSTGGGGVVPAVPLTLDRTTNMTSQLYDVAFQPGPPVAFGGLVGDPTRRQAYALNGYPLVAVITNYTDVRSKGNGYTGIMTYDWQNSLPNPRSVLTDHGGTTMIPMQVSRCPDVVRNTRIANLLLTIEVS